MRDAANAYARRAFTPCACTETDAHTLCIPTRTALMGRAWAISGTAVLLGAAGHTLAGASAPHLCTALGALMSLGLLLVMIRMRNRIPQALTAGTALGAVAVQALLHTLFNLSHAPSLAGEHIAAAHAGTAAHGAHTHTLHNHVLPGNTPYDYAPSGGGVDGTHTLTHAAAEHAHMPMFGVHLVAAIASLGVLYSAERTLARLIRLLAMKVRALGAALFTPPAVLPLLGRRILLYIPNAPATERVATLKYCRIERGPPAFV